MRRKKFGQILLLMLVLWWVLTGSADAMLGQGWYIGLPIAFIASWVALATRTQESARFLSAMQWHGVPQFIGFFLSRSLLAGIDVAKRTLSPSMPLNPDFVNYSFRLPPGAPQYFFMLLISLLPGTLAAAQKGNTVRLHVLDNQQDIHQDCRTTEEAVARLFGCELARSEEPHTEAKSEDISTKKQEANTRSRHD